MKLRVSGEYGFCSISPLKGRELKVVRETKTLYILEHPIYKDERCRIKVRKSTLQEVPLQDWSGRSFEVVGSGEEK